MLYGQNSKILKMVFCDVSLENPIVIYFSCQIKALLIYFSGIPQKLLESDPEIIES